MTWNRTNEKTVSGRTSQSSERIGMAAVQQLRRLASEFACIPDEALTDTVLRLRTRSYRRHDRLFLASDPADRVFLVTRGRVKSFTTTPDGKDLILYVAGSGELVGETAPFDGIYSTSAEAIDECAVIVFPADIFTSLCEAVPQFSVAISRLLSRRLTDAQQQASSLVSRSVSARLASLLRMHGEASEDGTTLSVSLTHLEMAQRIGSSRETVTAMLSRFRRMGMIEIERQKVTIRDRDAFEACIDGRLPVSTRRSLLSFEAEDGCARRC